METPDDGRNGAKRPNNSRITMNAKFLRTVSTLALAVASATALPQAAANESFGTPDQGYFIPAYEFSPINKNCALEYYTWYYYNTVDAPGGTCTNPLFVAQLELPEGALVYRYTVFAYDNDAASDLSLIAQDNYALYGTGASPGPSYDTIPNSSATTSGSSTDYQLLSSGGMNWVIDTYKTSGTIHHDYDIRLNMPKSSNLRFRGVWVFWARQIAPAPATATFSDVPTSHPFFNEVQQLTKAGITGGCGGGKFCPDAAVTRGQMAAFLSRALGLHWDYETDAP